MLANLLALPTWHSSGALQVVVESPRGSGVKLKYDPEASVFRVSRPLIYGLTYPYDWGFIPSTCAADGDPLDAMVLSSAASCPGAIWTCDPIGLVCVTQPGASGTERVRNDRVLAVPRKAARAAELRDASALSARERQELEQFFLSAVILDKPGVRIEGIEGAEAARRAVQTASERR
ncbi:MAG TPA: inorganic diphosphatase [Polyangiaceae bacterium]|nr:inorganic diphosphatase [Polyangiaceae bacterium]